MRIDGDGGIWWHVVDGRGDVLANVVWVDDETLKWCQHEVPLRIEDGEIANTIHKAVAVAVDRVLFRITITRPQDLVAIPPEVHNTRRVDADGAIAAVRAMCEGNAR